MTRSRGPSGKFNPLAGITCMVNVMIDVTSPNRRFRRQKRSRFQRKKRRQQRRQQHHDWRTRCCARCCSTDAFNKVIAGTNEEPPSFLHVTQLNGWLFRRKTQKKRKARQKHALSHKLSSISHKHILFAQPLSYAAG